ncbi:MAG: bifunctional 4-hydroxy-2-oxoglutarate aldolase/2-dehydro-3-deoxy-phosphogluconate aldolase [Eubacteriales bacterium]|jgi:2-dehydro-3-deoxyphosphogluconate aldolase/(4S)-4-hydroxy-2-oxoglutarate aldolase
MSKEVLQKILDEKIVAIVRGIPSTQIEDLAGAILAGGIHCIEVTFDQSSEEAAADTCRSIRRLKERFGDELCVGAGTVMTVEQVHQAVEAGAEYMISPNVCEAVIRETKKLDKVSMPGAFTPSEVADAYAYGADIVKMFPAAVLGVEYIKAVRGPLKHIPLTAVGGVTPENCMDFIKAGCVGVSVGGALVSAKLVNEGRFDEITAVAQAYVKALRG